MMQEDEVSPGDLFLYKSAYAENKFDICLITDVDSRYYGDNSFEDPYTCFWLHENSFNTHTHFTLIDNSQIQYLGRVDL